MRKVLIISFCFPPNPSIGSLRPYGLSKYLKKFGWEAIILTVKYPGKRPEDIRIIETPYKDIVASLKSAFKLDSHENIHQRLGVSVTKNFNHSAWRSKSVKLFREIIVFPDDEKGWFEHALQSAIDFLNKEKVDAIISTSFPVTAHIVAHKLRKRHNIPWIADFRDLWTQSHYYDKYIVTRFRERRLERKTLANADILVTVSQPLAKELETTYKDKKVLCITNGYDPYEITATKKIELTKKFTVTYTGSLYNGKRDPLVVFKTVRKLIDDCKVNREMIEIRFYGCVEPWLVDEVARNNLDGVVSLQGMIPRSEVLIRQKESQLLLLLLWDNEKEAGVYTGKVFEYLCARRPIIAMGGPGGVIKELLDYTAAGKFAHNIESLEGILIQYYSEFLQKGEVTFSGNDRISDYSYENIAERYAGILDEVASGRENG